MSQVFTHPHYSFIKVLFRTDRFVKLSSYEEGFDGELGVIFVSSLHFTFVSLCFVFFLFSTLISLSNIFNYVNLKILGINDLVNQRRNL